MHHEKYLEIGQITELGLQALAPFKVKRAIFIAAGMGKRMHPITINTPKPLVRINGVRIIDRLIDACYRSGIDDIYIVRGFLAEQFDQLLYKYPKVKFVDNPIYNRSNNIESINLVRDLLPNAYVFEADLFLRNPQIIHKYHYSSDFLAIKKTKSEDWCFMVKDGIIKEEKIGGIDCWQMVGISYWNEKDGLKLSGDITNILASTNKSDLYWENVPLIYAKDHYSVSVQECHEDDIVEIDTYDELKNIDSAYAIK